MKIKFVNSLYVHLIHIRSDLGVVYLLNQFQYFSKKRSGLIEFNFAKSLYNMKKLQSFYDLPVSLFIIPQLLFVETYKLVDIDQDKNNNLV